MASVFNFADDKKIAKVVNNVNDSVELRKSINNFMLWCDANGLSVNESKCKIIFFTHKKNPNVFNYFSNGKQIERVNEIRDLGVQLDSELSFSSHRELIKKNII